ncbi:MAG: TraB/GumN family protein [Rhizobiaceae bacterium]|nr:TraB/GumN family protein [Rhizobiaceae bacterium]MCV0407361.1 TraB/GumN family protein [Rhizobiaceae bacterium]
MKRHAISLGERAASASVALIAVLHLFFAAAFFASLLLYAAPAASEERAVCNGSNLLDAIAVDDPEKMEAIRAEAAETVNGDAILYRVTKPGVAASHVFGTMHMTDPRILEMPEAALAAFEAAETVVIETTDVLDPSKAMTAMAEHPELMMFTGETSLTDLLPKEDVELVKAGLEDRGIPFASVARMKPWMLAAMVALPPCEMARKNAGAPVLDFKIAGDAKAAGKPVEGLETIVDQLSAMASLPMDFHIKGLVETIRMGKGMEDVVETMIVLYESGETGMFWPMFRAVLPAEPGEEQGYAAFEEAMVTARNRTMAENSGPIIDRGGAFIAVGALHLPGETGLVALLEKAGYTVEPIR